MNKRFARVALIAISLIFLSACDDRPENDPLAKNPSTTWVIQNALIYDGTGGEPFNGNIRITDGKISEIGSIEATTGEKAWDAKGLVLAPGFIDPHSHHDTKLMKKPAPASALGQGITTIVSGLDGGASTFGAPFVSIEHSMSIFEQNPAALNLAYFAPHDTYREIVMGEDFKRAASDDQLDQMIGMLERDLKSGALGLSTGLEYEPSLYSTTEEVVALAKVAAKYGGKYTSHIRSEDVKVGAAIEEVLTIAREANIPANISHIKLAMYELFGGSSDILKKLNDARAAGLDITAGAGLFGPQRRRVCPYINRVAVFRYHHRLSGRAILYW